MKIRTKRESTSFSELDLFRISISCKDGVIFSGGLIVVESGSVCEIFMIILERVGSNGKSRVLTGGNVVEVPVAGLFTFVVQLLSKETFGTLVAGEGSVGWVSNEITEDDVVEEVVKRMTRELEIKLTLLLSTKKYLI